ncbi:MAG: hypothetical protein AAF291_10435 [Pseudomonadota bacterium]
MNAVSALTPSPDTPSPATGAVQVDRTKRLRLRVLAGRGKGAEHCLPPDRRIMVGHSYENDVVLRDATSAGVSLSLTPHGRLAMIEVIAGEITVLGRTLAKGERITLEPYVPVRLSGFVFAIGDGQDEQRWSEAAEIAEQAEVCSHDGIEPGSELPATNLVERIDLRTQPVRNRHANKFTSPLVLLVAAATILVVAGAAWFATARLAGNGPSRADLGVELANMGYPTLSVERARYGGGLSVVGLVSSEDDIARLKDWTEAEHPDVTLGVATLQSAAEAADNLLAAHNVDADVVPDGTRGLLIESEFLPQDRKVELEALLMRDLPRVRTFTFANSAERGESDLAYFFNAPGYGAASFVSGDPSYIVTEDGTRWFEGANLPTGHTIIEILGNRVTVERDGLRDTLIM